MSPNKLPPKTAVPIAEEQGAFLDLSPEGSGSTEPMERTVSPRLTEVPEGIYQEPAETPLPPAEVVEATRQAVATENRRRAQLGKHSPLQEAGRYVSIKPGDYLPGFGPVTYTNLTRAEEHAGRLEASRQARRR